MPLLSIIIAAHNSKPTLADTLDSLVDAITGAQDVEVIILNDDSDDDTQLVIDSYADQWPHYQSQIVNFRNIGLVRNLAIKMAQGEYITMFDSDDLLKPGSIKDALDFLRFRRPDMLLTHLLETHDVSQITPHWDGFAPVQLSQQEAIRRFLIQRDFQAHLIGQFIKRDIYLQEPIPAAVCYEDLAVFPAMLMRAKDIWFQQQGHYYYIKRKGSQSSTLTHEKISLLFDYTIKMEEVFPSKFIWLVACHWMDIYLKHRHSLSSTQLAEVSKRLKNGFSLGFFLSPDIRLSYKNKAIKLLWKK